MGSGIKKFIHEQSHALHQLTAILDPHDAPVQGGRLSYALV